MRDRTCGTAAAVVLVCVVGLTSPAAAQSVDPLPAERIPFEVLSLAPDRPVVVLSDDRLAALQEWTLDYGGWLDRANDRAHHTPAPLWSVFAGTAEPAPPPWLGTACELLAGTEQFVRPCELLAVWRDDPGAKSRHAALVALIQKEAPEKTIWWQHLHIDGLWSTTQSNVSALGLFGMHMTVTVVGRVQVFVAPGIMLVSVPTLYKTREVVPAADWGVSYRLFNVGSSTVHLNLVHAWMLQAAAINANTTLAGLSVTFRPRRH